MKPSKKTSRAYSQHGLNTLRTAVTASGKRLMSRRFKLGRELFAWRAELVEDLGGPAAISTQQAAIVELAVRTKLLLDSIDAWILVQPSPINARRRAVLPVVRERQQLADALSRYMGQLGLERRARPMKSLAERIEAMAQEHDEESTPHGAQDGPVAHEETAP